MIRSATPGDLWALQRKARSQVVLYNEALLAQPHNPLLFGLRSAALGPGRDGATFVFRERGAVALVQAQGRSGRPEQDVVYLAAHGTGGRGLPSDHDIWFRLLELLCAQAARSHVQRIYAALSNHQEELREVFRQVGFQGYARQMVLQLNGPDWDQGITLAPMRPQSRRDAWAIHKLYGSVTPHLVQHAEARSARAWMLPLAQRWSRRRRQGWVLGPDDNLSGYLHATSGPAAHVFTLLIRPDERELVSDVLRFGLAQLQDARSVYLILREYQEELLAQLQDLGFQPIGEQALLVKSTVVPVRRTVLLPALEPSLEPQVTIPSISAPRKDAISYVRTARSDKQYRSAAGGAAPADL
jgi:hypothetical protein